MARQKKLNSLTDKQIKKLIKQADKNMDGISGDVVKELIKFFSDYMSRTKAMLNDASAKATEQIKLSEAMSMAQDLDEILKESGYTELRKVYRDSFKSITTEAMKYFEALGLENPAAGLDRDVIKALRTGFVKDLDLRVNSKLVQPLRENIIQSVISGASRTDAINSITRTIQDQGILRRDGKRFYDFNTNVLVGDSHRRFYRSVRAEKAKEIGLQIYVYRGPNDGKTRDVCRLLLTQAPHGVPGAYYRDEIKAGMVKGLKHNPLYSGGGFNCRHEFLPISNTRAEELGFRFRKGDK